MLCCTCSYGDDEAEREILPEQKVLDRVFGFASDGQNSSVVADPEHAAGVIESIIHEDEEKDKRREESKADVSMISTKQPPESLTDVVKVQRIDEPLEDRPICCKLRPGHTVPDKFGVSRALSQQDYKSINDLIATADQPGWKQVSNMFGPKTTKKFMKAQEGSPLIMIKGVSPINTKAIDVFKFFSEPEVWNDAMKISDVLFMGGKILEVFDAHHIACHAQFRTPPGITNRDFCFSGLHAMFDEQTAVSIAASLQRADCPPAKSEWKFVRGEILTSGYIARDSTDGKGCELTYIVQVDPKGWLPSWVVNIVASDQADNVTRIAKHFATK
mmetsp:Transcript_56539/g.89791  ORF Transcript_56539/g.89791 Transcript_56539/m.89791 type:complete len:330 (-) Transcript_56539:68-1057(-)